MTNLIDQVKRKLPNGCLTNKLRKSGCTVKLDGAPTPSIKIDMDKCEPLVKKTETRCDYIFIGGGKDVFFVPLEVKPTPDATKIVNQLQAGADIADLRIIPKNKRVQVQFQPVVAHRKKFGKQENLILRDENSKIHFRGEWISVERLKCGAPLTNAVDFC